MRPFLGLYGASGNWHGAWGMEHGVKNKWERPPAAIWFRIAGCRDGINVEL
jgi:hypothetical protein